MEDRWRNAEPKTLILSRMTEGMEAKERVHTMDITMQRSLWARERVIAIQVGTPKHRKGGRSQDAGGRSGRGRDHQRKATDENVP